MTTNTPQYLKPLEAAKAYVALVGSVATALLAVFTADTEVGKVLLVLSVIATAVATYKVPNADSKPGVSYDIRVSEPDGHSGS